ncbi:CoA pyrophosphatase OS=Streptomyces rimosus subsp. rimosus (strain ATCC / DSM 40260 / JCM 4667/ NRRL 2234) OX=1265868 GN=SRIM_022940 PE=4 SV=1 [Streptomyces rimosus subsp. rimosus]
MTSAREQYAKTAAYETAVRTDGLPQWLAPVARAAATIEPHQLSRFLPPETGGRPSAVLVLFGTATAAPSCCSWSAPAPCARTPDSPRSPAAPSTPRTGTRRARARCARRCARPWEETGLDPAGVQVFGVLPRLYIPVSGFVVTPVLGWWRGPQLRSAWWIEAETARVFTVPVADLTHPAHRATTRHPSGFHVGPAFLGADALRVGFHRGRD